MAHPGLRQARPGDILIVVHEFDARGDDELTLRRGDKIELVELDDGFGDGWYLGKHMTTGNTGLFPAVYTTLAPTPTARPAESASSTTSYDSPSGIERPSTTEDAGTEPSTEPTNDVTPPASRRASAPDMGDTGSEADTESPSQPRKTKRSSSSPLPGSSPLSANIQRSIGQALDDQYKGADSPVMNETLSVIDEHITDLSTPRHSLALADSKPFTDSGSEYSNHIDHHLSYIRGHETDEEEEEEQQSLEEQVRQWDHVETARQLRNMGVEPRHCEIFMEQEISGDVLLDMDQEFLLMKEFDFGVMGRRLKTWHKIKAFQEQIKGFKPPSRGSLSGHTSERSMSRTGHNASFLPRIPSLSSEKRGPSHTPRTATPSQHRSSLVQGSPSSATSYGTRDLSGRPSAASVRDLNHSRRHSAIDSAQPSPSFGGGQPGPSHSARGSFDRNWTMTGARQAESARAMTEDDSVLHQRYDESDTQDPSLVDALDRGYFSGGEVDSRRGRKSLRKRDSAFGGASHSRQSSYVNNGGSARNGGATSHTPVQSSSSARTKGKPSNGPSFFSPFAGRSDTESSTTTHVSATPLQQIRNVRPKFRRVVGLRAASDGGNEKVLEPSPISPTTKEFPATGNGSTTPSAASKSSGRHSTDGSGKAAEGILSLSKPKGPSKVNSKSKKDTSAYMRGLEKKTPKEQMEGCDYSGWMKKRSANMMASWKPRLFVLRGRRLSYYYSENDTEERGLIDITAHRVLRVDNDPFTTLHATLSGAINPSSPPMSSDGAPNTSSSANNRDHFHGPFIFKLVPPKSGASRTVQFTKPTTHYFQVDSVEEGRRWMAALMKATIDRDMSIPVETSNKQKTISLKQARLMNQRPPALMESTEPEEEKESVEPQPGPAVDNDTGLNIQGVDLDKSAPSADNVSDVDRNQEDHDENGLAKENGGPQTSEIPIPETLAQSLS